MGWREEGFEEPPAEVLGLLEAGVLEDVSWHNEAAAGFWFTGADGRRLLLWVAEKDPDAREYQGLARFAVEVLDADGAHLDPAVYLVDTDNLGEALELVPGVEGSVAKKKAINIVVVAYTLDKFRDMDVLVERVPKMLSGDDLESKARDMVWMHVTCGEGDAYYGLLPVEDKFGLDDVVLWEVRCLEV